MSNDRTSEEDVPSRTIEMPAWQIGALVCCLLIGVGLGILLLSQVFQFIPTDVRRLAVLLEAFETRRPEPRFVVFGNSVLMSGIDARAISAASDDEALGWNCASTGQTLVEAYLLTQELPASVDVAIYGIPLRAGTEETPLNAQKYNTLYMNGYRPQPETLAALERIYGRPVSELLGRSYLSQVFESRWALRQFVDTQTRMLLRSDLALDRSTYDLFHPQSYEKVIDPKITARFVDKTNRELAVDMPAVAAGSIALAREIAHEASRSGRRTVFLIPPIHPDILEEHGAALDAAAANLAQALPSAPGSIVVDTTRLLDHEHFIDDKHPTNEGALVLTRRVAQAMSVR